jgi:carbonic anhydrase/acetyltransferase-like protein (isoleucine patch superfamily)
MQPDQTDRRRPSNPSPRLLPNRLVVAPDAFIARTAVLRGDVTIGRSSSVWFNAVVRGDLAPVVIGEDTNIQDGAILHVETDGPAVVGSRVTVGHMAVVHAAHVEDDCLIAIGSLVLSGARIGSGSIIGAGAVVKEGWVVPPRSLVLGVPGRIVRQVSDAEAERIQRNWAVYVEYAASYRANEASGAGGAEGAGHDSLG